MKLWNAIYTYYVENEATLWKALKDGNFSKTKEKLSDTAIQDLDHSKRWEERYSKFLQKLILPGATQRHCLNFWIDFSNNERDQRDKPVWNTERIATEQLKKVHHASNVPVMNMFQKFLPGPRLTHGMSKWKFDRPELPVEKFHELLAHFGNFGMNKTLANTLTLEDTT
jgi:hypothetical protein